MTATTATPVVNLPKNKTGVFAGDNVYETKSIKSQPISSSRQSRNTGSTNIVLVPNEQNHVKIQQFYRVDQTNSMKKEEKTEVLLNKDVLRNGFRPSPIRRQKHYDTNSTAYRDSKVSSPKQCFSPSNTSNKLKADMNQINGKLKVQADLNKILRGQQSSEGAVTPRSNLSYNTTYRVPSACTNQIVDRSHQRFPSSMTHANVNTLSSFSGVLDICSKSTQSLSGISEPTLVINDENNTRDETNQPVTHAYQIPQQSNVGMESFFGIHSSTGPFSVKANAKKSLLHSNGPKSVSCPFYVMYFTNLAMQKQQNNPNDKRYLSIPATRVHFRPNNYSRTSTSYTRYRSGKKRLNTPVTIIANLGNGDDDADDDDDNSNNNNDDDDDDDESGINGTVYYNRKRFSAKIAAYEHENSTLLKDVLRTTSWNHVQM